MGDDIYGVITNVAKSAYVNAHRAGSTENTYEKAMSDDLFDREINHETNKKIYDEHKGKYRYINIYFPEHRTFVEIKKRKYITRADLKYLKENEVITGFTGYLINFFDGVDIRDSGTITSRVEVTRSISPRRRSNHFRRGMNPRLNNSTGRLSDPSDYNMNGHRSFQLIDSSPAVRPPNIDFSEIFSITCAAFFFSGGNRENFATALNDFLKASNLKTITLPKQYLEGENLKIPEGDLGATMKAVLAGKTNKTDESIEERLASVASPTNDANDTNDETNQTYSGDESFNADDNEE